MSKLKFVWRIILRSFLSNQDDFSNHVFMTVIRAHIKLRLELRQGVEGGGPDPAFPLLYSPLFFFFFFSLLSRILLSFPKTKRHYRSVHLCVLVSYVGNFFFFFEKCNSRNVVDCYGLVETGEKRDLEPQWTLLSM